MKLNKNILNNGILGSGEPRHYSDWNFDKLYEPHANERDFNRPSRISRRKTASLPNLYKAFLNAVFSR